jgi:hypothetical protein
LQKGEGIFLWVDIVSKKMKILCCDMMAESQTSLTRKATIARQGHDKHVSIAINQHATMEELLEVVFSVWSMLRLYSEAQRKS